MSTENNKKNPFQDTLNLPTTDFSLRANSAQKEPEILQYWENEKIYSKTYKHNIGKEKFILHDGPPYANGNIHLGHVLNKVLKDIVAKYNRMAGKHVPVKPGWDCHGLPIELKVTKEKGELLNSINNIQEKNLTLKKYSREYVNKWIDIQKQEFKNLGVCMDWDNPYITMSPEYESLILKAFSKFVENGYIERKNKTVPWCASCSTVLAAAEIEYKDRKDPSIYVLFELSDKDKNLVFSKFNNYKINFLIWTTTPWTLPLNRAVVLNSNAKYSLLDIKDNKAIIVASDLVDKLCKELNIEKNVLLEFESQILKNSFAKHAFIENLQVPVILDNSVLLNEGTACVHSAPGCGPEDYALGVKNNLEIYSPLSADGKYTSEIKPKELDGMSIIDGQIWVLKKLQEVGRLFHKVSVTHSYPHCWRCHNGLMFRATEQWFCNLQKNNLIENALKEIEKVTFYPDWGKTRLHAFVSNRTEWCISRQRTWGVPIPAVICKKCAHAHLTPELVAGVAEQVKTHGIEYWDKVTIQELVNNKILLANFACKSCKNNNLEEFKKETDILDVWFDSGVSSFAVLQQDKELAFPADLYLEGSDQHRGWFQSSLLSSMVLNNKTQTKTIVTHGFTVDEKGHKMSKSVGNVIAPDEIIKKYSRDILRLFVSSVDYQNDIVISHDALNNVMQAYKKIRNTCRFLISNLYDFDINKDAVNYNDLLLVDKYALNQLYELNNNVLDAYNNYNFAQVFHLLNSYCANNLSALYLDISKDRLYTEKFDSALRRSAQTVSFYILDTLTRLMAPILSFLAEEVSGFYLKDKKESIHLYNFMPVINIWDKIKKEQATNFESTLVSRFRTMGSLEALTFEVLINGAFNNLEKLRDAVLKAIEEKRKQDLVKHSLEAKVTLYLDQNSQEVESINFLLKYLTKNENINKFFKDWFIVSQLELVKTQDSLDKTELAWASVKVEHALGDKCPRCWQWEETKHSEKLCARCASVLGK
ncbi:MAG: Isoleucine-tRNA ligase [candidate division TM6 bacterium GW2011_GWF2_28_16]|nr:MAG: Isoleucine-tRNA ligase [candidate division TM6 bacterium GW2011_GWF2_28_16]